MAAGLEEELHPIRRGVMKRADLHFKSRCGVEADIDQACCLWLVLGNIMSAELQKDSSLREVYLTESFMLSRIS